VTIDDSANEKVFGKAVTGKAVMAGKVAPSAVFAPFVDAVRAIAPSPAR
jgi:hypothetical protein